MKKARFYKAKLRSPYGVISTYESGNLYELHQVVAKRIAEGFTQIHTTLDPVVFEGIEYEDRGRRESNYPNEVYIKVLNA
jgi:hypothetical protein